MRNFVKITQSEYAIEQSEISIEFELQWKKNKQEWNGSLLVAMLVFQLSSFHTFLSHGMEWI